MGLGLKHMVVVTVTVESCSSGIRVAGLVTTQLCESLTRLVLVVNSSAEVSVVQVVIVCVDVMVENTVEVMSPEKILLKEEEVGSNCASELTV